MKLKKWIGITLATTLLMVGCGKKEIQEETTTEKVAGEITVVTNRTDADEIFDEIEKKFIAEYPDVTAVHFENISDYDSTVMTRINGGDYGDVLFIPFSMAGNREEYPNYFASLGTVSDLKNTYLDVYEADYDGEVYGLPVAINSLGIIYNEGIMELAGVIQPATSVEQFIQDLEAVKEKTDAVPFYSNYQALAVWAGSLTSFGGEQFKSATLESGDAFAPGQPIRQVMDLFYEMSSKGLIEEDPMTLDSQTAFHQLAEGEIAMLMNGSQEVAGIQSQSEDKIEIMNFPIERDGKTSLPIGAPAVIGINKHTKNMDTSKAFVDFFVSDKSGYAKDLNGMPTVKADLSTEQKELIDNSNVILTVATETPETNIQYSSIADEVGVARLTDVLQQVINIGLYPDKNISYDEYVHQLSENWQQAAKANE